MTQTNDSLVNSTNKRCLLPSQFKRKSLNYTKTSAYIYERNKKMKKFITHGVGHVVGKQAPSHIVGGRINCTTFAKCNLII